MFGFRIRVKGSRVPGLGEAKNAISVPEIAFLALSDPPNGKGLVEGKNAISAPKLRFWLSQCWVRD